MKTNVMKLKAHKGPISFGLAIALALAMVLSLGGLATINADTIIGFEIDANDTAVRNALYSGYTVGSAGDDWAYGTGATKGVYQLGEV